jgi:cytochrome c oxidase assembly protein subunit 15
LVCWELSPLWRNFFENELTVQFMHRLGGYLVFARSSLAHGGINPHGRGSTHCRRAVVLFGLVTIQALIGIVVDRHAGAGGWALAHQGWAVVVLGFAVAHWRGFHGAYPLWKPHISPELTGKACSDVASSHPSCQGRVQ